MIETDRLISAAQPSQDEEAIDRAIRPKKLVDYTGQAKVREQMEVFIAAAKNLYERGKRDFVLGVEHELALPVQLDPDVRPPGAFSMRGYSVGGFGSVTTNKVNKYSDNGV